MSVTAGTTEGLVYRGFLIALGTSLGLSPVVRLEEAGLVNAEFRATERGPVTDRGREVLAEQAGDWFAFGEAVRTVLSKGIER
ncbi:hypothetical protein [Saccharopolyspora sp. NPDC002376]